MHTNQRGMTLVEVMIAMTLGLLVTLAVTSLFLSQQDSYRQNEAASRMQENARFALELITQDLRHAGFFGELGEPIDIAVATAVSDAAANNCAGGIFNFTAADNLLVYANDETDTAGTELAECVATADLRNSGSSILFVKRSAGTSSTGTEQAGTLYTYSNGGAAQFVIQDNYTLSGGESWEYTPHLYYIDNENTLQRKFLTDTTGTLTAEPIADSIEAFHIEFGIDTNNDGTPDYFWSPDAGELSDSTITGAVSATVYILARTPSEDRNYNDSDQNKTYQLGAVNPIGLGPFNDGFHRRVYSMTTELKNLRGQIMLQGS